VLAFALPWGAFAVCGRPALAWLARGSPAGAAVLAASVRFMSLLAVFFVFDFAINFLSALLRAAQEQASLLKATARATARSSILVVAGTPPDAGWLMGTFITAQAAWAVLLLGRVVSRWPRPAPKPGPAAPAPWYPGRRSALSAATATSPRPRAMAPYTLR